MSVNGEPASDRACSLVPGTRLAPAYNPVGGELTSTNGEVDPEDGSEKTSSYAPYCELPLRGPITAGVNELEDDAEWESSASDGLVEAVREDNAEGVREEAAGTLNACMLDGPVAVERSGEVPEGGMLTLKVRGARGRGLCMMGGDEGFIDGNFEGPGAGDDGPEEPAVS